MNIKMHLLVQTKEMAIVEGFMRSAGLWNEHERHVKMQEIDGTIGISETDSPVDVARACIFAIVERCKQEPTGVAFIGAQIDGGYKVAIFAPGIQKLCINEGRLMTCMFSDYLKAIGYAHETEQNMVVSSIENNKPLSSTTFLMDKQRKGKKPGPKPTDPRSIETWPVVGIYEPNEADKIKIENQNFINDNQNKGGGVVDRKTHPRK